jgi:hypothetical protein
MIDPNEANDLSIQLPEIILNGSVCDVIDACVIREKTFSLAIEATGVDVISQSEWLLVNSNDLNMINSFFSDKSCNLTTADLSKLWTRKISYKNNKKHSHLGSWMKLEPSVLNITEVLNVQIIQNNMQSNNRSAGYAILSSFSNLSPIPYCNESNYLLNFCFKDIENSTATSVKISIELNINPSIYQFFIKSMILQDIQKIASTWKAASNSLLQNYKEIRLDSLKHGQKKFKTVSWAARHLELSHSEIELRKSIGILENSALPLDYAQYEDHYEIVKNETLSFDIQDFNINQISLIQNKHLNQWRTSAVVLRDLQKAPSAFIEQVESLGLKTKSKRGILFFKSILH